MTLEPWRRLLQSALAILVLVAGSAVASGSPPAEDTEASVEEPDVAKTRANDAARGRRALQTSPERRERRQQRLQEWWIYAREVLFADIELDAKQARGVDAIIETQLGKRARFAQLDADLKTARRQGDRERSAAIRVELRAANAQLKQQHELFEEMRALLTPEQRPIFDTNRARLAAEERASRRTQQEERAGHSEAGKGTKIE